MKITIENMDMKVKKKFEYEVEVCACGKQMIREAENAWRCVCGRTRWNAQT